MHNCKKCTALIEEKVPHRCMSHATCTTKAGWSLSTCLECCQVLVNWSSAEVKEVAHYAVKTWGKKISSWMSRVSFYCSHFGFDFFYIFVQYVEIIIKSYHQLILLRYLFFSLDTVLPTGKAQLCVGNR